MIESLLKSLELTLSIGKTEQERKFYKDFMKSKEKKDAELDKKQNGLPYSQLAIDTSLREQQDISENYNRFIVGQPK